MNNYLPAEGEIKEGDIPTLLYRIHKNAISGLLVVKSEGIEKRLVIENEKIVFAASNLEEDSLGSFLLRKKVIDKEVHDKTDEYLKKNSTRFGRALLELGFLDYDRLWKYVQDQLKEIVLSLFAVKSGQYRILANVDRDEENIVIDWDIPAAIAAGMRRLDARDYVENKFKGIERLYVRERGRLAQLNLKPYEVHVYELAARDPNLEEILKSSELLRFDTLRILYMLLVLEVISLEKVEKPAQKTPTEKEKEFAAILSSFRSFGEALAHYNMKYESIYKALSKEIGPIALSILSRAVQGIVENLPSYLQRVKLNPGGSIDEEQVLKSLWYHDFDKNIGEFLRGLEEILYAEIYTVKEHLGEEYEQQVLKWMNKIGD